VECIETREAEDHLSSLTQVSLSKQISHCEAGILEIRSTTIALILIHTTSPIPFLPTTHSLYLQHLVQGGDLLTPLCRSSGS